jgi:hypothetical protein
MPVVSPLPELLEDRRPSSSQHTASPSIRHDRSRSLDGLDDQREAGRAVSRGCGAENFTAPSAVVSRPVR